MSGAILFDLDGTLVDSLADIGEAMNFVLAERGHPTHALAAYRTFVGEGARSLVQRSLPAHAAAEVDTALAEYRAHYRTHLVVRTQPYDGILPMLRALETHGVPFGVVTNKPHDSAIEIVERLFPGVPFAAVLGQRDGAPQKPDPAGPLSILHELGRDAAESMFVGDSDIDMQTATNAGMIAVGVRWGFRDERELREHGARHVVSTPAEIVTLAKR